MPMGIEQCWQAFLSLSLRASISGHGRLKLSYALPQRQCRAEKTMLTRRFVEAVFHCLWKLVVGRPSVLCSSARARACRGVLCSSARETHMRSERGRFLLKVMLPPLVQLVRVEVFEELLVRAAHVIKLAPAAIPVLGEQLGVGELGGDLSQVGFASLPLLALLPREGLPAHAEHLQERHVLVGLRGENCSRQ